MKIDNIVHKTITKNFINVHRIFINMKKKVMKTQSYIILIILTILFHQLFASENSNMRAQPQQNNEDIIFPQKTEFTESIINGLGSEAIQNKQRNFVLYYNKRSYAEENVDELIPMIETAIERVKDLLGVSKLSEGFYLVMVDSRDEMERIINWNVKGLASGRNDSAIFVYNKEIRPYFKHELFHLITFNIWGEPSSRVLDEGGAVYSDNECLHYDDPLSTINKYLFINNEWFEVDDLINNFNEKAGENDLIAYLQAGFIFRYLYKNYGKEKMITLWRNGFVDFEQIYKFNINELASRVKEEMKKIKSTKVDWDELMDKGCG